MPTDVDLIAKVLAFREGRAFRRASHRLISIPKRAIVLCPIAMAGEDVTIHAIAFGYLGEEPKVLSVADPRNRTDQFVLMDELHQFVDEYFDYCLDCETFPQVWVSSEPVARHLDLLADRLRYNRDNPAVAGLGTLLTYPTGRYPTEGQQTLITATSALKLHWATGQQDGEDEHLGALLAWIDPPPGKSTHLAVAEAEAIPMGSKTDPAFDRDVLAPLVADYNTSLKSASPTQIARKKRLIHEALTPIVTRIYGSTQLAASLLARIGLPELPDLQFLEEREAKEFSSFMARIAQGFRLARRDTPKAAVFGFVGREIALENYEAAISRGDRVSAAGARLAGRVLRGEVVNARSVKTRPYTTDLLFTLSTDQRVLRVRRRDELVQPAVTDFKVVVHDVVRTAQGTEVSLQIINGQRKYGLPANGSTLDLTTLKPEWERVDRTRKQLSQSIGTTPWTHTTDPLPRNASRNLPTDALALVEGLRQ